MSKFLIPAAILAAACVTPRAKNAAPPPLAPATAPAAVAEVEPADTGGPAAADGAETAPAATAPERAPSDVAVGAAALDASLAEVPLATYTLRRGETLAHFARWSELPIEAIAAASGLSPLDDQLPVGTVVRIPLDHEGLAKVEAKRDAHKSRRALGWLDTHGGEIGTEFYRVKTGDSAWTIAKSHGAMPVWVLETYNPAVDLDALRPGQELMIPIVASYVASDE